MKRRVLLLATVSSVFLLGVAIYSGGSVIDDFYRGLFSRLPGLLEFDSQVVRDSEWALVETELDGYGLEVLVGTVKDGRAVALWATEGLSAANGLLTESPKLVRALELGASGKRGVLEQAGFTNFVGYGPSGTDGRAVVVYASGGVMWELKFLLLAVVIIITVSLVLVWGGVGRYLNSGILDSLNQSHAQIESIVETAVDGIVTISSQGIITSFNRAAVAIFGYSRGEVIGKPVSILMGGRHKARHQDYIGNYLRTGDAGIIGLGRELIAAHKDGREIPIDLALSEVDMGRERTFTGIIRDITVRKRAEQESRNLNRILRELHSIASLRGPALDEKLRALVSVGCTYFGLSKAVLSRREGNRWVVVEACGFDPLVETNRLFSFPDKSTEVDSLEGLPSWAVAAPEDPGWSTSIGDVEIEASAWIHCNLGLEEQLFSLIYLGQRGERKDSFSVTDLEVVKLVGQWIAAEIALEQEQTKVQRSDKLAAIGVLAAGVAHEVNNPLAGVITGIDALHKGVVSEEFRDEYFVTIREGLNRIRQTVQGLLDYSRRKPVAPASIDLADLVTGSISLVTPAAQAKGVTIEHSFDSEQWKAWADHAQLMQGLVNVLLNAVAASPANGTVWVRGRHRSRRVGIVVDDEGTGIPEHLRERVLTPFFSTKPEGEGTGLGLPITQALLSSNHGELEIGESESRGASITLWLPIEHLHLQ